MDTTSSPSVDPDITQPTPPAGAPTALSPLSRRGFLRTAAISGGGLVAVGVAACAPAATAPGWTYGPALAAFTCDTLGVKPGERWDVVIECDEPGAWDFHCHILPHAEGMDGMYGMFTALVVQNATAAIDLAAAGAPAFTCVIPSTT